nr:uncharacterized mitochondrial protein AtMg00810-like [Tanacetum cinerariifolium]
MDSIIPLGQKNTLAKYIILSGANNGSPMLDKDLYDSWKSRMELNMQNREHERMILESVKNDPLIWPTVEENGVTRTKKHVELSAAQKIQADCDMEATNIILQGDDIIAYLNKAMAFLIAIASLRVTVQQAQRRQGKSYSGTGYKSNATSSEGNNASGKARVVKRYNCQKQLAYLADLGVPEGQAVWTIIPNNAAFQTEDLDICDFNCDDISNAKAGKWGFEHNKAIFNNEIIPFLKSLEDIFNVFDKVHLNEIIEVQTVFYQMDDVVQLSSVDKQCLEITKEELLLENDRILQQIMSQDILLNVMNSMSLIGESVNMERKRKKSCDKCFNLDAELLKSQNTHNNLLDRYSQLEKHCIFLESSIQLNQEIFQKDESCDNQNALEIPKYFQNNDLKTQLQDKDTTICKLEEIIKLMREKSKEENVNYDYCEIETKNVELENSVAKLLSENERLCKEINHVKKVFKEQFDSIKKTRICTKEQGDSLIDKLNLKSANNKDLKAQIQDKVESSKTSYSNTPVLSPTGLKCSTSNYGSKPTGNKRNDMISQTPSKNMKNKVEAQPRKVNKKNCVVKPIRDVDVKHLLLSANHICATCKKSMFDGAHDMITLANVVPPKKTTSHSVETQKPELKVYNMKPKNVKNIGSSKKAKIVESKNDNHSKLNHTWGSNATDIPSSSSLIMVVRFGNDHIARIMRYGDYQLGNVTISRVYYVEGYGYNLFPVGQFCDADLEVTFQKNTCFICNLEVPVTATPRAVDLADSPVSTSIEQDALSKKPKNFKQAMTKPSWINVMQEEIHEFKRLQVLKLVSCPDKVMLIKLKWIYKVKTNEFGRAKTIKRHLNVVKRIFLYLKGTINMGLWYSKDAGMSLTAYADVDHARCQDTRRSTSGSAQFLGDKLVSWLSKKQKIMSSITAQQTKLDLELVSKEKRPKIRKYNRRLNLGKIQREPTFQVVLDALALTP